MNARTPTEVMVALHVDRGGDGPVLISIDGENRNAVWIGRRLIEKLEPTGKTTKGTDRAGRPVDLPLANLTIPEWLAIKEGLV